MSPGTDTLPLCLRPKDSPFWVILLLVWGWRDRGMILDQWFPKPKVGGSTHLGTAMKSNENFKFVARASLPLFAKSVSGAARGYTH